MGLIIVLEIRMCFLFNNFCVLLFVDIIGFFGFFIFVDECVCWVEFVVLEEVFYFDSVY